jgi:hypothetical protein
MLLDIFSTIPDHRRAQGRQYDLGTLLFCSVLALMSGAKGYKDICTYINGRFTDLKKIFNIKWRQAPKRTMVNDTLRAVKDSDLEKAFREYSNKLHNAIETDVDLSGFALDGKSLRGSYDNIKANKVLHVLTAFCVNNQLILGHISVGEKTNEIPCAQELIKQLGLPEGSIYTLDAMHCQKKRSKRSTKPKVS